MQMIASQPYHRAQSPTYVDLLHRQTALNESALDTPMPATSRFAHGCGAELMVVLLVGTGGAFTPEFVIARDSKGYRLNEFGHVETTQHCKVRKTLIRTPAEDLAQIREILKPSITQLAALFGVTRQAIYNWEAGKPIAEANQSLLTELALAANILRASGVSGSPRILSRKVNGGLTLLESIRNGASGEKAALNLIGMVEKEAGQRKSLEQRFASRPRKSVDVVDVGVPHTDERA
jgi:DNA-binding transcriptional regulator YiaG